MLLTFQAAANGKLLLSGEYFVLDGAQALALPTRAGQTMLVQQLNNQQNRLIFKSYDHNQEKWFEATFDKENFRVIDTNLPDTAATLATMLTVMRSENTTFLSDNTNTYVTMSLEFPRDWGLGSSSTLIYCLAEWAAINPYLLLEKTMGGSGYDIACAGINQAIVYQRNGLSPKIEYVDFAPAFSSQLYFVHLTQKQNSREGIVRFRENKQEKTHLITQINMLTQKMLSAKTLNEFEEIIITHETLISNFLAIPRAKDTHFHDFWGEIKSLGAWGGDFVMATSTRSTTETLEYFHKKGFTTVLTYQQMIKPNEV